LKKFVEETGRPSGLEGVQYIQGEKKAEGRKFAIVASRFNPELTDGSLKSAVAALITCGADPSSILIVRVPGAYEIPPVIEQLAQTAKCDALIAIGTVIEGETPHAQLINESIAQGLNKISIRHGVPVIDCVVAVSTLDQAEARCLSGKKSRGWYAGMAAAETSDVYDQIRKTL
jgi:6,7-dimethyl-8-ribityllumazine synthase